MMQVVVIPIDSMVLLNALIMYRSCREMPMYTFTCAYGHQHSCRVLAFHPEISSMSCLLVE